MIYTRYTSYSLLLTSPLNLIQGYRSVPSNTADDLTLTPFSHLLGGGERVRTDDP